MFKYISDVSKEFNSHIGDDIQALVSDAPISLEKYQSLKINSYEDKFLEPHLSDEAFLWKLQNAMKYANSLTKHQLPRHYDEYLATDGVSELLKRFMKHTLTTSS